MRGAPLRTAPMRPLGPPRPQWSGAPDAYDDDYADDGTAYYAASAPATRSAPRSRPRPAQPAYEDEDEDEDDEDEDDDGDDDIYGSERDAQVYGEDFVDEMDAESYAPPPRASAAQAARPPRKSFSDLPGRRPVPASTLRAPPVPRARAPALPVDYDEDYDRNSALDEEEGPDVYPDPRFRPRSYSLSSERAPRARAVHAPPPKPQAHAPRASFSTVRSAKRSRPPPPPREYAPEVYDDEGYDDEEPLAYEEQNIAYDDEDAFPYVPAGGGAYGRGGPVRKAVPAYSRHDGGAAPSPRSRPALGAGRVKRDPRQVEVDDEEDAYIDNVRGGSSAYGAALDAPMSRIALDNGSEVGGTHHPSSRYSRTSTNASTIRSRKPIPVDRPIVGLKASMDIPRKGHPMPKRSVEIPREPRRSMDTQRSLAKKSLDVQRLAPKRSMDIPRMPKRSMEVPRMPKRSMDVPRAYSSFERDDRSATGHTASKVNGRLASSASVINSRFAREGAVIPPSPRIPDEFRDLPTGRNKLAPNPSRRQREAAALAAEAAAQVRGRQAEWEEEARSDEQERSSVENLSEDEPYINPLYDPVPQTRKLSAPSAMAMDHQMRKSSPMGYPNQRHEDEDAFDDEPAYQQRARPQTAGGRHNEQPDTLYDDEESELAPEDDFGRSGYRDDMPRPRETRASNTPRSAARSLATTPRKPPQPLAPPAPGSVKTILQQRQAKAAQQAANPRAQPVGRKSVPALAYDQYGNPLPVGGSSPQAPWNKKRGAHLNTDPAAKSFAGSRMLSPRMDDVDEEQQIVNTLPKPKTPLTQDALAMLTANNNQGRSIQSALGSAYGDSPLSPGLKKDPPLGRDAHQSMMKARSKKVKDPAPLASLAPPPASKPSGDPKNLTPEQRHYLVRALVSLQLAHETSELEKLGTLTAYGAPFSDTRPELARLRKDLVNEYTKDIAIDMVEDPYAPDGVPEDEDLVRRTERITQPVILRHLFHTHMRPLPGLDTAPAKLWQLRIQPLLDELAARNFSTTLERAEVTQRRYWALSGVSLLSKFFSRGIGIRGKGEESGPGPGDPGTEKWGVGKEWGRGTVKRGMDKPVQVDSYLLAQIDDLFVPGAAGNGSGDPSVEAEVARQWKLAGKESARTENDARAFKEYLVEHEDGLEDAWRYLDVSSLNSLPSRFQNAAENLRVEVATFLYTTFVDSPEADASFRVLKGVHTLFPWWATKQLLRYSNPQLMIQSLLGLLLARPAGSKSLLQRIAAFLIKRDMEVIEKDLLAPLRSGVQTQHVPLANRILDYVKNADRIERLAIERKTLETGDDVVTTILLESPRHGHGPPNGLSARGLAPVDADEVLEMQRCFGMSRYRGHVDAAYPRNSARYSDRATAEAKQAYAAARAAAEHSSSAGPLAPDEESMAAQFALLKLLLRESRRLRDRQQALEVANGALVPTLIKDALEYVFYDALKLASAHADLGQWLDDLQAFMDDLITTRQSSDTSPPAWVALCKRHEDSLYGFIHELTPTAQPILEWIQLATDYMALGTSDPAHPADRNKPNVELNVEALLADGRIKPDDAKRILREIEYLQTWTLWQKVRRELEKRRDFLFALEDEDGNVSPSGLGEVHLPPDTRFQQEVRDIDRLMQRLMKANGVRMDDGVCRTEARGTEAQIYPQLWFDDLDPCGQHLMAEEDVADLRYTPSSISFPPPNLLHTRKLLPAFRAQLSTALPDWRDSIARARMAEEQGSTTDVASRTGGHSGSEEIDDRPRIRPPPGPAPAFSENGYELRATSAAAAPRDPRDPRDLLRGNPRDPRNTSRASSRDLRPPPPRGQGPGSGYASPRPRTASGPGPSPVQNAWEPRAARDPRGMAMRADARERDREYGRDAVPPRPHAPPEARSEPDVSRRTPKSGRMKLPFFHH